MKLPEEFQLAAVLFGILIVYGAGCVISEFLKGAPA